MSDEEMPATEETETITDFAFDDTDSSDTYALAVELADEAPAEVLPHVDVPNGDE